MIRMVQEDPTLVKKTVRSQHSIDPLSTPRYRSIFFFFFYHVNQYYDLCFISHISSSLAEGFGDDDGPSSIMSEPRVMDANAKRNFIMSMKTTQKFSNSRSFL